MEISPGSYVAVYGASSTSSSFLLLVGPRHFFPASPHFHSSTPLFFIIELLVLLVFFGFIFLFLKFYIIAVYCSISFCSVDNITLTVYDTSYGHIAPEHWLAVPPQHLAGIDPRALPTLYLPPSKKVVRRALFLMLDYSTAPGFEFMMVPVPN